VVEGGRDEWNINSSCTDGSTTPTAISPRKWLKNWTRKVFPAPNLLPPSKEVVYIAVRRERLRKRDIFVAHSRLTAVGSREWKMVKQGKKKKHLSSEKSLRKSE
jgi:hypothetical protein